MLVCLGSVNGVCEMSSTILYLVFGNKKEFQLELTYSVLSAVRFIRSQEVRIALVCDQDNCRPDLPVENLVISSAEINSWIIHYKYAAKAHALWLGLERYGGAVALVDTDTVFSRTPLELFRKVGPGRPVMHAEEGTLGDHAYWSGLLNKLDGPVDEYDISSRSRMMNSGVVALHETDKAAVPNALRLMKKLHEIESIFNIEQLSFTEALGKCGVIEACDDIIWHYWGHHRRFAHTQIGEIFSKFDKDTFDPNIDALPPIGMPPIPARVRARARLLQVVRRCDDNYRFAYIALLCAIGGRNNEWAHVALDVIEKMERIPVEISTDFGRFRGRELSKHAWLSSSVRQRWQAFWSTYEQSRSPMHVEAL